jgi:hypothetical protein
MHLGGWAKAIEAAIDKNLGIDTGQADAVLGKLFRPCCRFARRDVGRILRKFGVGSQAHERCAGGPDEGCSSL